ncbi:thiamine pyrophosphate enzyme, N-terminal TPP binding domain-containing protein [Aspergillus avenaceus]|uniref:Thiamine pyrophosphate enzyme, N-terminal TPP binding domain-containing protein n=1 Tax=Aspergillus avenaceus TaxID=36643 RepID=A0A5N6TJP3_ASPAV|nr:thiamine pyrophosphate enzyme, N-terminal TPP binding domain-containing protein [Aspergillus avenaceus]
MNGGDLLAKCLQHLGVQVAFGLHGGHLDAFLAGCEAVGIRLVDTRHETAAVQAAEGYARMSSKLGVCFVTANSGFSNGIPGLATAFADRSPIVCITSSVPLRDTENNSLQGSIDQVTASSAITKFAHRLTHAEDCPRILAYAVRVALTGAPGPVLLDVPIDVMFSPVHPKLVSHGSISCPLPYAAGPHPDAVKESIKLVMSSQRPVIITGSGASQGQVKPELMAFAERYHIPIFNSSKHIYTCPKTFGLYGGAAQNIALLSNLAKVSPDLVLLLGARTGMFLGGRSGAIIPPGCKLVQVDVDGSEIGRTLPVDVGIVSDLTTFLTAANQYNGSEVDEENKKDEWIALLPALQVPPPSPFESESGVHPESGLLHPYHALKQLFSTVQKDCIVILDGGEASCWALDLAPLCEPSTVIAATGYLGFLGAGFGYVLGCAVAAPDKKIIHIQGDGSAGFHFMELDTYRRFGLDVLTVVVNNSCWGMSRNGQDLLFGSRVPHRPVSSLQPSVDFKSVAQGLGVHAARVSRAEEMDRAVMDCQQRQGPGCIDLIVDRKPTHPMVETMVGPTSDPNVIVVSYYDNIPRPRYDVS